MRSRDTIPRIVGVAPGPPFDLAVWSGSCAHLLDALSRQGALAGAVDARPPLIDLLEKLSSFSPRRQRWRQRVSSRSSVLSPLARRAWSRRGGRGVAGLGADPDAVLQLGGWCDLSGYGPARPVLRASYHDGNLATYLQRPGLELDPRSKLVRRAWEFERRLYDGLDVIFTMSDWVRNSFVEDFEQDPAKVVTVYAGANITSIPEPGPRELSRPRFLFVGKGDFARKGGPQVLRAFERVRDRFPDAELCLVGPKRPPSGQAGVHWLGRIARTGPDGERAIDRVYRDATTYVMPSVYEPFGIAFLEAMSYRLPCVGAACCAMPEIIEDGVTGYVVPPGDVDLLAERLLELAADSQRALAMGEAGYRRFLDRYTWDRVAARIVEEIGRRLVDRS